MPKKLSAEVASTAPDELSIYERATLGTKILGGDANSWFYEEDGIPDVEQLARAIDAVIAAATRSRSLANPRTIRELLQNVVGPEVKDETVRVQAFFYALAIADFLDSQPGIKKWQLSPHTDRRLDLIQVEATPECVKILFRSRGALVAEFHGMDDANDANGPIYEIRTNNFDFDSDCLRSREWSRQKILDSDDAEFNGAPFLAALKACDETMQLLQEWSVKRGR